jgi:hypothetical protein
MVSPFLEGGRKTHGDAACGLRFVHGIAMIEQGQ